MHGFQEIAHFVAQVGSLVLGALGTVLGVRFWKSEDKLDAFGRFHATPLARTCDALLWTPRQFKKGRPLLGVGAAVHLVSTTFFPVAAVVLTNVAAVDRHPVAFGLAGVIAGVIAEAPEAFARNAHYRGARSHAAAPSGTVQRTGGKRLRNLAPDQKVAAVALPVAVAEAAIGVGLYYLQDLTTILGAALSAVVLGVAFVAWAEVMSVISTLGLVSRNGSPFKPVE
jgi:hypothetical protein